jgi:hypothetical protein
MKGTLLIFAILLATVASAQQLPNSPEPKPDPCKGQKAGSLCNGRRYYPDLLKMSGTNKTWKEAAKTPGMIFAGSLLVGMTVLDIESSQHCIHTGGCREANPILGQTRAQQYGVAIPITGLVYYLSVREKQHGHGLTAFAVMYGGSMLHFMGFAVNRMNSESIKR